MSIVVFKSLVQVNWLWHRAPNRYGTWNIAIFTKIIFRFSAHIRNRVKQITNWANKKLEFKIPSISNTSTQSSLVPHRILNQPSTANLNPRTTASYCSDNPKSKSLSSCCCRVVLASFLKMKWQQRKRRYTSCVQAHSSASHNCARLL